MTSPRFECLTQSALSCAGPTNRAFLSTFLQPLGLLCPRQPPPRVLCLAIGTLVAAHTDEGLGIYCFFIWRTKTKKSTQTTQLLQWRALVALADTTVSGWEYLSASVAAGVNMCGSTSYSYNPHEQQNHQVQDRYNRSFPIIWLPIMCGRFRLRIIWAGSTLLIRH
jgi:hypothetical protein